MKRLRDSYICELLKWAVVDIAPDLPLKRLLGYKSCLCKIH